MLKKIIAIKNVGRFRNSATVPNPLLAKHTVIVGANGYGKTTICSVLRSLKSGKPEHVLGRKTLGVADPISIDLLFENNRAQFNGGNWSISYPSIEIFDGIFVSENIHSGEVVEIDQKRNLYRVIIGEDGVRLAEEEAKLAASSRAKTGEITSASSAIQPHVPAGMTLEAFLNLSPVADIDDQIAAQERIVEAARQASAIRTRAALAEIALPILPEGFESHLALTFEDLTEDAERIVADHLANHSMVVGGGNWLAEGLKHADQGTCPFCGQGIDGLPLIATYRAVFNERYAALGADNAKMTSELIQAFNEGVIHNLGTIVERNKIAVQFWREYCSFDELSLAIPPGIETAIRALAKSAVTLLNQKALSPLEACPIDANFVAARGEYEAVERGVAVLNNAIREINALIAAKKEEASSTDVGIAEIELVRRKAIKTRHNEPVVRLAADYARLVADKADIERRKDATRERLGEYTKNVVEPYERRIKELLAAFNAGFSIAETKHSYPGGIAASSYQLVINNTAIDIGNGKTPADRPSFKNTLSAGDKTTLALAFFLAHLERDSDVGHKIVVFDDPSSSQDSFRRRQTVHEITKISRKCTQVIVLSHDATFLKQVWDKAPASDRAALAIADHRAQGSKIMPIDLVKACLGRTATDIDDLQAHLATGVGGLLDIIRKMRVVLETYCRTTYPSSFLAEDWLGDIVRKTRDGGEDHPAAALFDELDQINDYTKQYHHGEDIADATPDQIDPTELTGFVRRTLRIVNALQA